MAAEPVGPAMSDFDAALHLLEKWLRLYEWQVGLVLEGLTALNRALAAEEVGA